jgi:hypothetical protein
MIFLNPVFSQKTISELKQPFQKECITSVTIEIANSSSVFRGDKKCEAIVNFKNGETTGRHRIHDDDPEILFKRLKVFIDSI